MALFVSLFYVIMYEISVLREGPRDDTLKWRKKWRALMCLERIAAAANCNGRMANATASVANVTWRKQPRMYEIANHWQSTNCQMTVPGEDSCFSGQGHWTKLTFCECFKPFTSVCDIVITCLLYMQFWFACARFHVCHDNYCWLCYRVMRSWYWLLCRPNS